MCYIQPQLYELVTTPSIGEKRVHQAKLDGYRTQHTSVLARRSSTAGKDWVGHTAFPKSFAPAAALCDCIIDGEVCAVRDGLREDKSAKGVIVETPAPPPKS